jgi:hypothetical protein
MDILSANKSMAGAVGGVIIHVIDTGVNPIPELKPVLFVIPFLGGETKHEGGTSSCGDNCQGGCASGCTNGCSSGCLSSCTSCSGSCVGAAMAA